MYVRKLQSRIRLQSHQNAAKQRVESGGNFTSTIIDIVGHGNYRTLAYDLTHWCTLLWSLTGLLQICSLRSVWVCSVKPKLSMTSSHTGYDPKSTCLNLLSEDARCCSLAKSYDESLQSQMQLYEHILFWWKRKILVEEGSNFGTIQPKHQRRLALKCYCTNAT
jgi:hypothetical protein